MSRRSRFLSLLALFGATAATVGSALAADPLPAPAKPLAVGNRTCPVRGEPVDPKVTAVWNDLEIGFCCPECAPAFRKEPERYTPALVRGLALELAEANAKLAATAASPAAGSAADALLDLANPTCPVMGGKTKDSVFTTYHGMKIHFCCPGCDRKFQADPKKYLEVLRKDPNLAPKIDQAEAKQRGHDHH